MDDDLRGSMMDYDVDEEPEAIDDSVLDAVGDDMESGSSGGGLSATERLILAVFGFLNVVAFLVIILIITGRIG